MPKSNNQQEKTNIRQIYFQYTFLGKLQVVYVQCV